MPFLKMRLSRFVVGLSLRPLAFFYQRCYLLAVTKGHSEECHPRLGAPGAQIGQFWGAA
jgi:hypothetical protein